MNGVNLKFNVCYSTFTNIFILVTFLRFISQFFELFISISTFLQRVSIACYAKRCISYRKSVRLSVRPSVCLSVRLSVTRWHCVKTTQATIMGSSLYDSPMTLVSSWLTSARNSKGNLGSVKIRFRPTLLESERLNVRNITTSAILRCSVHCTIS